MRPVYLLARVSGTPITQAKLSRTRDINMYGFSASAAMIKPKNCSKNTEGGDGYSREERQLIRIAVRDENAECCNPHAHDANHHQQKPGWEHYCRYRNRHDGTNGCRQAFPLQKGKVDNQILPKMSVPFVPPNPNEFFTAILIGMLRAVLAQ